MYSFEIRILKVFYLENISFFELIDCIIIYFPFNIVEIRKFMELKPFLQNCTVYPIIKFNH